LSGAINNSGNPLNFDTNTGNINSSGIISGAGALTKNGSGTLTLSGNNTYGGTTNINTGTLIASDANALGNTSGSTNVNTGATLSVNGVALAAEQITLDTATLTASGTSSLSGAITLNNPSVIQSTSGTFSLLSGATVNNAGNLLTFNANGGDISAAGAISGAG